MASACSWAKNLVARNPTFDSPTTVLIRKDASLPTLISIAPGEACSYTIVMWDKLAARNHLLRVHGAHHRKSHLARQNSTSHVASYRCGCASEEGESFSRREGCASRQEQN